MSEEQSPDEQKSSSDVSAAERIIALLMAVAVLITLIFLAIQPRSIDAATFAIVRFLAAAFAGIAGYLFTGTIGLETTIPLNKTQIRATGAFATFVLVLLFFGFALPNATSVSAPTPTPISSNSAIAEVTSNDLEKKHPLDETVYSIVTAAGIDSDWRLSIEGSSTTLGTRAVTSWTQRVERNSEFELIYRRANDAYEIRPKIANNGDICLTTLNDGVLKLASCDNTAYQNFAIDCESQDAVGHLSGCSVVNKATNYPIGTEWPKDQSQTTNEQGNYINSEQENFDGASALWWSFVAL